MNSYQRNLVVFIEIRIFYAPFSLPLAPLCPFMVRHLLLLLSAAGLVLTCTQCATSEKERLTPASQRAFRLERAAPLVMPDTTPLVTASAALATSATETNLPEDTDYRAAAPEAVAVSAPADVRGLLARAKARSHVKEYSTAIAYLNMALRFAPTNADAYYQRGLTRLKLKQYPAAITDFTKATQYNPQCKEAYFGRGVARMQTLNFRAAIPDFTAAINLDGEFADAYEYRGISHASLNKPTEAKADLAKAFSLNPEAEKSLRRYSE
jgi:tetratricopeptide (TPR) repeat protein